MKDLGDFNYFLGIKVTKLQDRVQLLHAKYFVDLLANNGMETCIPMPIPMSTEHYLTKDSGDIIE